ncbi:hypothetical protein BJ993_004588 [Nocardioides aromaticivorans]|uniref:Uncharacterized protein n=1 Tax=Nocardioides aromaticivorans TaxID=200618 RepID=A0A7Y9ZNF1_9ACTN|nr:hypothetical protein [Nocardioides aromaticivorans]NYI47508.1 hypothetical protein [Nocardioides aromaticivorans]
MNQQSPARRRHLMDPNAPRKAPDPKDLERLQRVQRRVMSVLLVTTVLHLSVGLVIAADHVDEDRLDARIGLNVIATAFMVGGIAATLLINHRSWKSPWLLLGLLPGIVGIWWTVL